MKFWHWTDYALAFVFIGIPTIVVIASVVGWLS